MTETVTVSNLKAVTSLASDKCLAADTETDTQTHKQTYYLASSMLTFSKSS